MGTLLESNTHVAIPLLKAGLAKLDPGVQAYHLEFCRAQDSAITKKLKVCVAMCIMAIAFLLTNHVNNNIHFVADLGE